MTQDTSWLDGVYVGFQLAHAWAEAEAPRPVDLPSEGAASLKAAVIQVVLHYPTDDPLGG